MCSYSMVSDAFRQFPLPDWTRPTFDEAQEILRLVKRIDEKMGQKDCEDPTKAAWMQQVEERLKALENTK